MLISDFAVFSAIVLMVLVDFLVGLSTPKLKVPPEFRVNISHILLLFQSTSALVPGALNKLGD